MSTIETPIGTLYYTQHVIEHSQHSPVVLVHGAGGDHLVWPADLRRLPHTSVYCLDLPAHGRSEGDAQDTIIGYAEAVQHFISTMGIAPAIVIGHSMGGAITQTLALHMPDMVAGIVLIGTGPRLPVHPNILDAALNDKPALIKMINKWQWGPQVTDDMRALGEKQLQDSAGQVIFADFTACNAFDVSARLGEIHVPTLIIGGTADKMTPLALSESLNEGIANATLVTIEDGGHMMMLELTEQVTSAVNDWLEEHF